MTKLDFNSFSENVGPYLLEKNSWYLEYSVSGDRKYGKLHRSDDKDSGKKWEISLKFWAENLPYMIQIMDQYGEIKVTDLLNVFQSILDELIIAYHHFHLYLKPFSSSQPFFPFLCQLFNLNNDFIMSRLKSPQQIKQFFLIQKRRGTISGMQDVIYLLFNVHCTIHERVSIVDQFPRLLLPFDASPEMVFEVCLESKVLEIEDLKKIIGMFKPVGKICILTKRAQESRLYIDCIF
ncbi:MAG: hypothetical protein Kow00108_13710 [Calditrichia bacterium]